MTVEVQIPLFESSGERRRCEPRRDVVRHVDYCRFPRVCADQRSRVGFTRDVSANGLCLRTDCPEPLGSLLRVTLRGIDGAPTHEAIARVAWSRPTVDGSHWLGLALLAAVPNQPLRIRYLQRPEHLRMVEVA